MRSKSLGGTPLQWPHLLTLTYALTYALTSSQARGTHLQSPHLLTLTSVCMRQHTSAYVSIRQHTSAEARVWEGPLQWSHLLTLTSVRSIRQQTPAYVTSAYVSGGAKSLVRLAEHNRLIDGGAGPLAQTLKTPSSPINLAQHSLKCAPRLAARTYRGDVKASYSIKALVKRLICSATKARFSKLLVHAALSYWCMRP